MINSTQEMDVSNRLTSSTREETVAESETPVPAETTEFDPCFVSAKVDPTVAATSTTSSDLGTIESPVTLSDEQKYQILTKISAKLKEYPVNSQKRCYQLYWTQQFPWLSTLQHWMVSLWSMLSVQSSSVQQ